MRLAVLQLNVTLDKTENVQNALNKIDEVVKAHQPRLVLLPECFNGPIGTKFYRQFAEAIPDGPISRQLAAKAKQHNIYIVGGTIPEITDDDLLYNTCPVYDPSGALIGKHRKMHLFDVNVKGGISFKESETLMPGNEFTIVEVDGHKAGIGICYDLRFEEMARVYRNEGCELLFYPSAFNMTTGPLHWELLQRARATDNQVYVVSSSPSCDVNSPYVAYGHSMVVDPWGKVVQSAKEDVAVVVADIDFELVQQVRQQLPISFQRRVDLYGTDKKIKL